MKNRFKKLLSNSIVLLIAIVVMVMPTLAAPTGGAPDISDWARGILNDGERLGVYPLNWYYEDFRKTISIERLNGLVESVSHKLDTLELPINDSYQKLNVTGTTRNDVLLALHNTLTKYSFPEDLNLNISNPIQFLINSKILKGYESGYHLERQCTVEEATVFATRLVTKVFYATKQGSKGFMWQVENDGNKVYLLGSIHFGSDIIYPMSNSILDKFYESDELVVEANILTQNQKMNDFIKLAMYSDGTSLKDHISEELYAKCQQVFAKYSLPEQTMSMFRPWSIANDLSVIANSKEQGSTDATYAANSGVDMYFLTLAVLNEKPINELEGIIAQGMMFNNLSKETQEEYLASAIDSILEEKSDKEESGNDLIKTWLRLWKLGEVEEFKNEYLPAIDENNDFAKMLFGIRDKDMAEKIITMLNSEEKKTFFVVVGAGHLTVDQNIIDILTQEGYTVTPLN